MEQENTPAEEQQQQPSRSRSALSVFIPKGDYFFTPIIININIAVYLVMILSGVDPMFPSAESVLKWGADFRPLTTNGEPWRLLTSTFLHFGLIHIAVNMLSLYNIGRMLEPFIGRRRFLVVYLLSGIGGSCASIWWREDGVSAGASGAIVGIMGVLGALVAMPNLVRQEVRMGLLKSIGGSLLLLVLVGLNGFVDNAGHFGGLVIGAICGFLIYFEVKTWYEKRKQQYIFLLLAVLVTAGICSFLWIKTPKSEYKDPGETINSMLLRFDTQNNFAKNNIEKSKTVPLSATEIDREIIAPFQRCVQIGDSLVAEENLTDVGKQLAFKLEQYAEMRLNQADFIKRFVTEKDSALNDSVGFYEAKADKMEMEIQQFLNESAEKK